MKSGDVWVRDDLGSRILIAVKVYNNNVHYLGIATDSPSYWHTMHISNFKALVKGLKKVETP